MDIHTYISLYTGAGGLDLAYKKCNPNAIPLLYVERDFEAAAFLVDKIQTGRLDQAPIWSNTSTLNCKPFIARVDSIIGGFPCQPFSRAGKRKKTKDKRWLWHDIKRLVSEIQPKELFLENVTGLFMGGIQIVTGELSTLGYDAKWLTVSAEEVGAPHQRERVFILAKSRTKRFNTMANADNSKIFAQVRRNSSFRRSNINVGITQKNKSKDTRPFKFPPAYNDPKWQQVIRQNPKLAPKIPIKPKVYRMVDGLGGGLARSTKLKLLGNGVVPQQAAVAYQILKDEL